MPVITFQPSGISIDVDPGTELLDAAKLANIEIATPCGGKGSCGKCLVRVVSGEVNANSTDVLSETEQKEGFVQACRTKIFDDPVTIDIPEQVGIKASKFTDGFFDASLIRGELFPKPSQLNPLANKIYAEVPGPKPEDGFSDVGRLNLSLFPNCCEKECCYTLPVIRSLADMLRSSNGKITATLIQLTGYYQVIHIEPGDTTSRQYGIAIDVGTTTVSVLLIDQSNAGILGVRADYNAQIKCGLDIISRINYANRPDRLEELRLLVLRTINQLIRQVSHENAVNPEEICNVVISGNTTMIHLLLGLNPEYIRLEPYTPTLFEAPYLPANEIGIDVNPGSLVYISPAVGSYVGGDITAGLLCTDLSTDTDEINLFIDIGTNGEIAIGNSEFLMTCACSAGPAFEGGGIENGMRASAGAIESVEIDRETGAATCSTIGDIRPAGICGTGMISLLANLFVTGWMDPAGKLNRAKTSPNITVSSRNASYTIVPASETSTSRPIIISEPDIANIIRAKAAIYAACSLMLDHMGLGFEDIAKVYIAGGFGRSLDLHASTVIGLIPDLSPEKFRYIGNASLMGSYMVLVSQDYRDKQLNLARRMTYIDLSKYPDYMDQYTAAQFLPHTDLNNFPTVQAMMKDK
ncbi:MAG: hypothetical protein AMS26_08620 [Bacteroides sp. SM23_62]|nr:MAG: hypothetical protein AMS26_08620 [Bacteroides sp. SM23_62]